MARACRMHSMHRCNLCTHQCWQPEVRAVHPSTQATSCTYVCACVVHMGIGQSCTDPCTGTHCQQSPLRPCQQLYFCCALCFHAL